MLSPKTRNLALLLFAFATLLLPRTADAAINAGLVEGIWYEHTSIFDQSSVRIYAAVQNQSGQFISGTVTFIDGPALIAIVPFEVAPNNVTRVSTIYDFFYGDYNISAYITPSDGSEYLYQQLSPTPVFVDRDSDGDAIGDIEDTDDDNDGLPDVEEELLGTDPLNADTDNDGLDDGSELEAGTDPLDHLHEEPDLADLPAGEDVSRVIGDISERAEQVITRADPIVDTLENTIEDWRDNLLQDAITDTDTQESPSQDPIPITRAEQDTTDAANTSDTTTPGGAVAPPEEQKWYQWFSSGNASTHSIGEEPLIRTSIQITKMADVPFWKRLLAIGLGVVGKLLHWWVWTLIALVLLALWRRRRRRRYDD